MKKIFVFLFSSLLLLGGTFSFAHALTMQAESDTTYADLQNQLESLVQQIRGLQWRNNIGGGGSPTGANVWNPVYTSIVPGNTNNKQMTVADEGQTLSLVSPDGGTFKGGDYVRIRWLSKGITGNSLMLYVSDGNTSILVISNAIPVSANLYNWQIPSNFVVGNYRIVLKDNTSGATSAPSDGLFSVASGGNTGNGGTGANGTQSTSTIVVNNPGSRGGESYKVGDTVQIKWKAQKLPPVAKNKVSISLVKYENGIAVETSSDISVSNAGTYNWKIKDDTQPGLYKIRVTPSCWKDEPDISTCTTYGESVFVFEIRSSAYTGDPVKVVYPNGKEKLEIGKTYTIRWTAKAFKSTADVQLGLIDTRYSSEGGDRSEKTIANTTNTGSYKWVVPSNIGTMDLSDTSDPVYRIKFYVGNQTVNDFDQSDNTFSIIKKTQTGSLPTPTGLKATVSGTNVTLTWNAVSGATAYNIYRDVSTVSRTSARYLDVANGVTTYTDTSFCTGNSGRVTNMYYLDAYAGTAATGATQRSARSSGVQATVDCGNSSSLPTPTGLKGTALSGTAIKLTWNTVSGATGYRIKRVGTTQTFSATYPYYDDTGLTCGTSYAYTVEARKSGAQSGTYEYSPAAQVTASTKDCGNTTFNKPTGLKGEFISQTTIRLSWNPIHTSGYKGGYNIYKNGTLLARTRTDVESSTYTSTLYYDNSVRCPSTQRYQIELFEYDANWNIVPSGVLSDVLTVDGSSCPTPITKVISPNGGELYKTGDTIKIQWTATGLGSNNSVAVSVYKYSSNNNYYGVRPDFGITWYNDYTSGATLDTGSYDWTIPSSFATGQYIVFIAGSTAIQDTSDGPFSISSSNVSATLLDTVQAQLEQIKQALSKLR